MQAIASPLEVRRIDKRMVCGIGTQARAFLVGRAGCNERRELRRPRRSGASMRSLLPTTLGIGAGLRNDRPPVAADDLGVRRPEPLSPAGKAGRSAACGRPPNARASCSGRNEGYGHGETGDE